ncbi:hypothetical protein [Psychroserpens jangbogonensis]|uniref:hypothetical protein n=1 Tax=Psychroserpens jangbogonensis TaxID=1484460 RepID=UPI00053E81CC|nr:hypothetical protein [Psychroserpens jangbogonensis]
MNEIASNNSIISQKIAAILALTLGVMSVFAGSKVLLDIDNKAYNVLIWLVTYNVIFGAISIIAAFYIWKNRSTAKYLSLFILTMHFSVFMYLKFLSSTVASESIKAMLFRTSVWILIVVLSLVIPKYLSKQIK